MNVTAQKNPMRIMLLRLLAGMVTGATGMALFLYFIGDPHMNLEEPGTVFALIGGISYVLIGLLVALGTVVPSTGAKLLNVEDADELREEGSKLRFGAAICFLTGLFLLTLAAATGEPDGLISRQAGLIVAGTCLVAVVLLTLIGSKHDDELTRQINLEASTLTLFSVLLIFGAWSALAHLDYVGWASPLATIALLALLQLVSIIAVCVRRGMMVPR